MPAQNLHPDTETSCPQKKKKDVLVGLAKLPTWIPVFLETSPKGKTLPNQELG